MNDDFSLDDFLNSDPIFTEADEEPDEASLNELLTEFGTVGTGTDPHSSEEDELESLLAEFADTPAGASVSEAAPQPAGGTEQDDAFADLFSGKSGGKTRENAGVRNDVGRKDLFERSVPAVEPEQRSRRKPPEKEEQEEAGGFTGAVIRHKGVINLVLALIALGLAGGIVWTLFFRTSDDPYGSRILQNVYVAGVNVGGMTKAEALDVLKTEVGNTYTDSNMTVVLGNNTVVLTPAVSGIDPNFTEAVETAYGYGRETTAAERQRSNEQSQAGPIYVELSQDCLNLNTSAIRSAVESAIAGSSSTYTPSSYSVIGDMPALDAESYDASIPCQTLSLYLGTPGSDADLDGIVASITDAYSRNEHTVVIDSSLLGQLPEALDLSAIRGELSIEAKEAYTDAASGQSYDGSCGYTFSLEDAQAKLDAASYGDTVTIEMEYVVPEKLTYREYYPVTLSTCSTEIQGSEEAYMANLKLICRALDGQVLAPGASFSFNTAVGSRTAANGYASAYLHLGSCLDTKVGGGADQAATTLYGAVLCADLNVVEAHSCSHACGYTDIRGLELTVSLDGSDFIFTNSQSFPIQLRAKVSEKNLIISVLCEDETGWYAELESETLRQTAASSSSTSVSASSGYENGQTVAGGIDGGAFNLNRKTYDSASGELMNTERLKYVELSAATKLIASVAG